MSTEPDGISPKTDLKKWCERWSSGGFETLRLNPSCRLESNGSASVMALPETRLWLDISLGDNSIRRHTYHLDHSGHPYKEPQALRHSCLEDVGNLAVRLTVMLPARVGLMGQVEPPFITRKMANGSDMSLARVKADLDVGTGRGHLVDSLVAC